MKVVSLLDVIGRGMVGKCPKGGFNSYRYVVERDGMGFALAKTMLPKGEVHRWHYKNHQEACFCVSGMATLKNLETGEGFVIKPDDCYILDNHEPHEFQALTDTVLISVFNPPIRGDELHKEDGSYE